MATTLSRKNLNKPAPRWFRRTKKAVTNLCDTAVIMLLAMGYADNSFAMLCIRTGVSGVLSAAEAFIANGEEYTTR